MSRLARTLGLREEGFDGLLEWTLELRRRLGLPHTLDGIVREDMIGRLVEMAAEDPSLATNPKPCSHAEIERVMRKALSGDLTP
jgi:alcohol dehydrogenase class IV